MSVKVSFVVPIYNIGSELLNNCIESIKNQTLQNIELLLIDDGSTEEDAKICDKYAAIDDRIRVFHCVNQGVSMARNVGIENAIGEWIVFVDPDDSVNASLAECCIKHLNIDNDEILLYKSSYSSKEKNSNSLKEEKVPESEILSVMVKVVAVIDEEYDYGSCWGKAISREFLIKNNIRFVKGIKKAQDRIFMFDCYKCARKIKKIDFLGYKYNVENEDSICHKYNPNIVKILQATADEFNKRIAACDETELKNAENVMNVRFLYEILQLYLLHSSNKITLKKRRIIVIQTIKEYKYSNSIAKADMKMLSEKCRLVCFLLKFKMYSILTLGGYYFLKR